MLFPMPVVLSGKGENRNSHRRNNITPPKYSRNTIQWRLIWHKTQRNDLALGSPVLWVDGGNALPNRLLGKQRCEMRLTMPAQNRRWREANWPLSMFPGAGNLTARTLWDSCLRIDQFLYCERIILMKWRGSKLPKRDEIKVLEVIDCTRSYRGIRS